MGNYTLMVHLERKEGESGIFDFWCCVEKEDEKQPGIDYGLLN